MSSPSYTSMLTPFLCTALFYPMITFMALSLPPVSKLKEGKVFAATCVTALVNASIVSLPAVQALWHQLFYPGATLDCSVQGTVAPLAFGKVCTAVVYVSCL